MRHKNVTVANVLSSSKLNTIGFIRTLYEDKWAAFYQLVERLIGVVYTDDPDKFSWNLTSLGIL
jgi:hypothetical protein